MMTVPQFLPVLSAGAHSSPRQGACVMEYVSLLAGEKWSDSPSCTHPVLAAAARRVNDALPDSERQQLVPLIGRLFGTAETGTDHERQVLSVRLAVWSARQVLHLTPEPDRAVCAKAIDTAEAWCDGRATKKECAAAAYAAAYADDADADAAAYAAADAAAAAAGGASYAASYAAYAAAYAASYAAAAASYAANAAYARIGFLTALLDEYDRLTGRTPTTLDADQYATLAQSVR